MHRDKKYSPNERTDHDSRKRTKQNGDSQPINVGFKTLVIRMLRELTEYGHNIKQEMKDTPSEIKKNLLGTNSEGEEARIQINDLEQKEEINI